ncbi:MAG: D-glycero-beta-D-manno-heptose 1-phosphate adenylyltransferase [Bacteroidetes bacterium]|nr:D-glycero-beta-D-manno-heptose 1-phosphate adenylyltransferase [Bacteroidota bacterium]
MKEFSIPTLDEIINHCKKYKSEKKRIVFTNGCFDILHSGHVDYLSKAKAVGDILIVAINSDESVRRIKDEKRPILNENDRAFLVQNLKSVDHVFLFNEDTPAKVIKVILPDVLVKGADWDENNIVGRDTVVNNGGSIERIDFVSQLSTSKIIDTILSRYSNFFTKP